MATSPPHRPSTPPPCGPTGADDDAPALAVHAERGHEDDAVRVLHQLAVPLHRGRHQVRLPRQRRALDLAQGIEENRRRPRTGVKGGSLSTHRPPPQPNLAQGSGLPGPGSSGLGMRVEVWITRPGGRTPTSGFGRTHPRNHTPVPWPRAPGGSGFGIKLGAAHFEVRALHDAQVGGHAVADVEAHEVARHQLPRVHLRACGVRLGVEA